jgi:ABC-type transporter Mla subunit MlaD
MERPLPLVPARKINPHTSTEKRHLTLSSKQSGISNSRFQVSTKDIVVEQYLEVRSDPKDGGEVAQTTPKNIGSRDPRHGMIDNVRSQATKISNALHPSQDESSKSEGMMFDHNTHTRDLDHEAIFQRSS